MEIFYFKISPIVFSCIPGSLFFLCKSFKRLQLPIANSIFAFTNK